MGSGTRSGGRGGLEGESVHGNDFSMSESATELYYQSGCTYTTIVYLTVRPWVLEHVSHCTVWPVPILTGQDGSSKLTIERQTLGVLHRPPTSRMGMSVTKSIDQVRSREMQFRRRR